MPEALPGSEVVDWADLPGLDGQPLDSGRLAGKAVLVVNVASRCGLTPQYEGLERLQRTYSDRGFTVLGVPCNQFAGQEPGTPEEIEGFCQTTYGTTFPMTAKLEVNGRRRHPLYQRLITVADSAGEAGEIEWNFEKFLVAPSGEIWLAFVLRSNRRTSGSSSGSSGHWGDCGQGDRCADRRPVAHSRGPRTHGHADRSRTPGPRGLPIVCGGLRRAVAEDACPTGRRGRARQAERNEGPGRAVLVIR